LKFVLARKTTEFNLCNVYAILFWPIFYTKNAVIIIIFPPPFEFGNKCKSNRNATTSWTFYNYIADGLYTRIRIKRVYHPCDSLFILLCTRNFLWHTAITLRCNGFETEQWPQVTNGLTITMIINSIESRSKCVAI